MTGRFLWLISSPPLLLCYWGKRLTCFVFSPRISSFQIFKGVVILIQRYLERMKNITETAVFIDCTCYFSVLQFLLLVLFLFVYKQINVPLSLKVQNLDPLTWSRETRSSYRTTWIVCMCCLFTVLSFSSCH